MSEVLNSWISLNKAMRSADEDFCNALLKMEMGGKRRKQFMLRIHSRLNKMRKERERKELVRIAK
ncbi:hypothetical protein UFOVP1414_36 [uncultured Caudovirales phage]|uniref:Uncharacterized protein n=1 Tax=uncultured Caudovirales phage TaxID=2100421 RepID=A0A6J5SEN5_9CAUD|nr:hypothetical protein UFOVP442_41 [uncultured Caudovirales phage]CAB4211865.1 hypothetical protein UFOVP1414_36 [uncultured Caudovirales phage]